MQPTRPVPRERLQDLLLPDRGLPAAEIRGRRARYGANDVVARPPETWIDLVRDTARDPMIWFLAGVSALFAALGQHTEALVLAVALVPLAGMDAWLHRRTQASTRGLASRLAATATTLREGVWQEIPTHELVPGDLVRVASGTAFPADGIIVAGAGMQVDESALTGEAWPVRKQALPPATATPAAVGTQHWGCAGTRLLTGSAQLRVALTGGETLYGEIARSALAGNKARTPLQQAIARLVTIMVVAALIACALLAAIRLAQGHDALDALLSAVTLAVAALPEEFPVVFTFFLGVGVYRLARRKALVRRAVAVENIGRVTCICTDKTGTLTAGMLRLAHAAPADGIAPDRLPALAALAARADSGDPMDTALLAAGTPYEARAKLATFPFTEDRRRETAIVQRADGTRLAVVKGAPETVFALCADAPSTRDTWRARVHDFAAGGHKVIACATRELAADAPVDREPGDGYRFAGLLAFEDPLREGVQAAVAACRAAGIRVVMVTGDHPVTAQAIGRELGLGGGTPVVASAEEGTSVESWRAADVIARATPAQKLVIVRALQDSGEIVAVTGDGVNDVPALQQADIGIAMGERGTQSAREVAAIVLLDDNFRTIVSAIAEGRQLFRNLRLGFAYLLLVHIPLVLSAALVPLLGYPMLFLPVHIVWLELIVHPTAMLVFQDLPPPGRLAPVQRRAAARFFRAPAWLAIGGGGLAITACITQGYERALGAQHEVEHARAMAIGALVVASAAITIVLSGLRTHTAQAVVVASLASLALFVQVPWLATPLHLSPLHPADWSLAAASGVVAATAAALARRD